MGLVVDMTCMTNFEIKKVLAQITGLVNYTVGLHGNKQKGL
jgi:hypothetical protein